MAWLVKWRGPGHPIQTVPPYRFLGIYWGRWQIGSGPREKRGWLVFVGKDHSYFFHRGMGPSPWWGVLLMAAVAALVIYLGATGKIR